MAAESYPSSQMGSRSANSEQSCAVQRDCVGLLPFSSLQRAARWPPCVPGASGRLHCVCGRLCSRVCKVLVAGVCGKTGRQLLLLLPWLTQETALVLAACEKEAGQRDTNGFTARGASAQKHRSCQASVEERSRHLERHRGNTYRGVSRRCGPGQDAVSL